MAKFGDKVQKVQSLAKERKQISLSALAVELDVSYYYSRTLAKAAAELDPSLVLSQLFDQHEAEWGPWALFDRAWFEAEKTRRLRELGIRGESD